MTPDCKINDVAINDQSVTVWANNSAFKYNKFILANLYDEFEATLV